MTPSSSFAMDDTAFEKELRNLTKKEFMEFRKRFRDFTAMAKAEQIDDPTIDDIASMSLIQRLKIISKKLNLLKKEFERRDALEELQKVVRNLCTYPEDSYEMDESLFQRAIHNMEKSDLEQFYEHFKHAHATIIDSRQNYASSFYRSENEQEQSHRNYYRIIKKWDVLEEEMQLRKNRSDSPTAVIA